MLARRQTLRDYQGSALSRVSDEFARLAAERAGPRVLLVAPTGAGKTTIAAARIEQEVETGGGVLFLAHRKELIDQCSKRLDGVSVPHGVVMAGHPRWRPWLPVQVASIASLVAKNRKGRRHRAEKIKAPTLIIVDEAHRSRADTYHVVLDELFPGVPVLGLTATPIRMDNRGLGDSYQSLVVVETIAGLTGRGFLVPATGFAFDVPDLKGVRTTAGDYNERDLATAMSRTAIVGNIVEQWLAHAGGVRSVLFAVNVEHSKRLVAEFRSHGVRAEHLDGETPKGEREAILARLHSGETRIVSNVGVLTEGWDEPLVECGILARPTKSLGLFLQMVGRFLRAACLDCAGDTPWNSPICRHCGSPSVKRAARIHDHAGCVLAHGLPEAERAWTLDDTKKKKARDDEESAPTVRQCGKCFALYSATLDACPACGTPAPKRVREIEEIEHGKIVTFDELRKKFGISGRNAPPDVAPIDVFGPPHRTFVRIATNGEKLDFLREMVRIARVHGRNGGWVAGMYETEFGEKPRWRFDV